MILEDFDTFECTKNLWFWKICKWKSQPTKKFKIWVLYVCNKCKDTFIVDNNWDFID